MYILWHVKCLIKLLKTHILGCFDHLARSL